MKKILASLLLILGLMSPAVAGPYFHFVWQKNTTHQILNEACFDPNGGIEATTNCTSVPVITHSHNDGYWLIPGEDYSPLAVGWAVGGQSPKLTVGPSFNLSPIMKSGLLYGLNYATPNSFTNLKTYLAPVPASQGPDLELHMSLKWGVSPTQNWKGYFLAAIGPALLF